MRGSDLILESLHQSRINEAHIYGDAVIIDNRYKLEDIVCKGLENKYTSKLSRYGKLIVDMELELTDDRERDLEDAADLMEIRFYFDGTPEGTNPNEILSALVKTIAPLKGFRPKYSQRDDVFYVEIKGNDSVGSVLWAIEKDGINLKRLYHVESEADSDSRLSVSRSELKAEKRSQEQEWSRSRA